MNEDLDTASAVGNYLKSRQPQEAARTSYTLATESNPDAEAEFRRLSKQAGLPIDSVRDNKEAVQRQVSAPDFNDLAKKFPSTTAYLSNLENSRIAHDDVGGLTEVEKAIRSFMGGGSRKVQRAPGAVMNSREYSAAVRRAIADNPALDETAARALVMNGSMVDNQMDRAGPVRGPEANTGSVVSGLIGAARRMPETFDRQLSYIAADILGLDQTQNRNRLAALETQNISGTPAFDTETGKGLYAGGVSTIQNAPGIALSIATGSPAPALTLAGVQSAVPAYSKYRERGASGAMAAVGALGEGAVEVATELLPMQSLLKVFGKGGQGAAMQFLKSQFQEQWTEQIATVAQDAIDTAIANPNKTWAEYVAERPGAAYQTFLATLVQTGAVTIAHTAAQKVTGAAFTRNEEANRAAEAAAGAESLTKLAEASKLRARDPESFAQFVNQVAEDSDTPTELFIDATTLTNTLNQAGITMERLAMVAPAVAAQLRAASFVPGADIRVPVAEFAAAGADITTPLIDHLRETPDAMSRAEAQEYLKTEGDRIQADVETELGKMGSSITARQQIDAVTARFETDLNAAGRFRPEVNKAYAGMMGNFYATQAARAGMPLEDFLNKYQLRVTGKTGQGAQTLEQVNGYGSQSVKDFAAQLDAEYPDLRMDLVDRGNGDLNLSLIVVPESQRNGGIGTRAIEKAIAYADANGKRMVLTPSADFGGNKKKLVEFYKRFGFKENKGKSKDFEIMDGMYREPKGTLAQAGRAQAATNSIATTVERAQAAVADFLGSDTLPNALGRVVTATAADIKATWEPLIGRNVQMESEGDAGAAQAFYDPASKTVFLIADNIRAGDEAAVLAHELMHKHGQAALGKAGWDKLHGVINTWANAPEDSDERAVYQYASGKVRAVGEQLSSQEMFPYAVEAALKMGVQPSKKAKAGTVSRWLNDVQTAMKTAWDKVTGKPEYFGTQDLVNLAYGIAQMENPALAPASRGLAAINSGAEQAALEAISASDELFALPRSEQDTVEGITADNDPAIKVKKTQDAAGRTDYQLTLPNGKTANLIVRPFNKYATEEAPTVYGYDLADGEMTNLVLERPGTNPEDVGAVDDVWIDASNLDAGGFGAVLYNIAATYAHNTGRKFIGDPAGLSDDALRRRTEQMLSSALKFGTTEHLAPHPRQVRGDKALGIPALKWTYGDDLGNIKALAETSLANYTDVNPVTFEPSTGRFLDSEGVELDDDALRQIAEVGPGREAGAGLTTLKRNAVLAALVREEGESGSGGGQRAGLLGRLVDVAGQSPASTRGLFYSRDGSLNQSATDQTATPAFLKWFGDSKVVDDAGKPLVVYHGTKNAPDIFKEKRTGAASNFLGDYEVERYGVFAAEAPELADEYANQGERPVGQTIMPLYMAIENPLDTVGENYTDWKWGQIEKAAEALGAESPYKTARFIGDLWGRGELWKLFDADENNDPAWNIALFKKAGWDGMRIYERSEGDVENTAAWVAFDPKQVKSAIGNNRDFDPANPNILKQPAYHGSPHDFEKFSTDNIGTGEGAQAFGYGLYFAENEKVAKEYQFIGAQIDPGAVKYKGKKLESLYNAAQVAQERAHRMPNGPAKEAAIGKANAELGLWESMMTRNHPKQVIETALDPESGWPEQEEFAKSLDLNKFTGVDMSPGKFYQVDIPDEAVANMLLWDTPLSEQPEGVKAAIEKAMFYPLSDDPGSRVFKGQTGQQFYKRSLARTDRESSAWLAKMGIPGIKYLDGGSRDSGDGTYNLVVFDDKIVKLTHKDGSPVTAAERNEYMQSAKAPETTQAPRATLNFASDITQAPSVIALLEGADLSSFLHESGHFFLEVQADLAARIQLRMSFGDTVSEAERGIVDDMNTLLAWFGVTDMPEASALDQWALKTLEERREAHETFARGFERYAMEGKAPTQELAGLFNKFRSWLVSIYQKLASLNVTLTDDVRGVMDRMLASDEAIAEAQAARNMGPLFQSPEQAGMTPAEYDTYQFLGERATAAASEELDARLMKDMKWLSRAKSRAIKAAQEEAAQLRRDTEIEVRREVMAQPIYQAWQILTGKGLTAEDRLQAEKTKGKAQTLDPAVDNLFAAIAKLGGLDKAQAQAQWGVEDKLDSGVFGSPVLRVEGGLGIDAMAERLVEEGYLMPDTGGRADLAKFAELFDDQRRGVDRYSVQYEFNLDPDGAPIEAVDLTNRFAKLNTEELRRRYGTAPDAIWRILSERRMTNDTGLDPDLLAESIPGGGFTSGDELVRKLAAAPPPRQVIEEEVDQRMMERYGDITSAEALSQAADEAVHNELRARGIATELKALQKAGRVLAGDRNTVNVLAKAAKEYAAQAIARQRVRDLRPSQYTAAEARSAKLAEQALGKDMAEAALHKRNQLINNYAARAAYDAQDEVKAMQAYFRKFDKRRDSIDAGYQDQIEALLERFDFKPASLKAIDKRKSFAAWYEEAAAGDNPPDVPDYLLDEASRKSYKDMTVEELRGLRDTVKQIEHQGRLKNKLLLARDKRDFDAAATAMTNSIVEHGGEAREVNLEGPNPVTDWFAGVAASHRKLASLFRQMDGNKDDGPMYDLIGRGMNERGTVEDVMVEKATVALRDIYAPLMKMRGGITGARSKLYIPEINASLTRGGRLAVALNWGNEANRQRIMDGDKWSAGQVQAILKTLSPTELKFVNDVWAYIDSYWEDIAAKEKRLTGVEPEKVQPLPFTQMAADGTEVQMRGGYYPLKYDTDRSDRADTQEAAQAAKEMMQGVLTRSTTRRGHTKERLKEVKRAVRKDLNVITQHITQVTHDLAWHEWLIDTNKLLQDGRVVSAIRDHYGPKVLKTMRDDVMGIATADVVPQTDIDKALLTLRGNVTRATMGASITTAFLQPFGLTQSMVRIGPQHVLRGMARWGGDAVRMENTVEWIRGKSEFMRLRSKTFNKELREIRGSVAGKSATMRVVDAGLFALMQKMQLVADVPTWIGQYEKSTAEGLDEAAAVAMADRAVLESQGGGATKDLAEVQRKHPMLTQFYSYFSVTLNLAAEQTAATDFKNPAAVAGWLGDMALLMVIPAILPAFIMHALKGGGGDDDETAWAKRIAQWQLGYLMGTIVGIRELSGAVGGFDYAGPPVSRIITDIGKAGQQTIQGEVDEPAVMAYIRLMGTAFGLPVTQALRSYKGWKAWDEGQGGAGPQSVLFGPPPKD